MYSFEVEVAIPLIFIQKRGVNAIQENKTLYGNEEKRKTSEKG